MRFRISPAYIVSLEVPNGYDQDQLRFWVKDRCEWLQLKALHPYQAFVIRNATEITQEMIFNHTTIGDVVGNLWVIHFSDPNEATLFKLTFG